jgi:hypothetical protein
MEKNYDPKLRAAMAEINNVMKRYDICGIVGLCSESHQEFVMKIESKWSLAYYKRDGEAVHLKLHQSKQPQLDQTGGMIFGLRDLAALFFGQLDHIAKRVGQVMQVDHKPFGKNGITNDDRGDDLI